MRIDILDLIYQLLPVTRRQKNRIEILSGLIDLVMTNIHYSQWQKKYSRILKANSQTIKLQRYLRDVFNCETIFIKERVSGKIHVTLRVEKINSELIFGLSDESRQYIQLYAESETLTDADYIIVYPVTVDTKMLMAEIERFNPVMKKYKFKKLL